MNIDEFLKRKLKVTELTEKSQTAFPAFAFIYEMLEDLTKEVQEEQIKICTDEFKNHNTNSTVTRTKILNCERVIK